MVVVCCLQVVVWRGLVGGEGCMEFVQSVSQVLYHVNSGVVLHAAL